MQNNFSVQLQMTGQGTYGELSSETLDVQQCADAIAAAVRKFQVEVV